MKKLWKRIEPFLLSNTLWMYLTLLLFISYLLQVSVVTSNWSSYLSIFGRLCFFYSPILLAAYFRSWLFKRLPTIAIYLSWGLTFIAYPLLLVQNKVFAINKIILSDQYSNQTLDVEGEFALSFFLTVGGAILATEIAILISQYLRKNRNKEHQFGKVNVEVMVWGVLVLMAFLLAFKGVYGKVSIDQSNWFLSLIKGTGLFMVYLFQYLFINLVYYFYYYINKKVLIPKLLKTKGIIHYGFSVAAVILVFYPIFIVLIRSLPIIQDLEILNYHPNSNVFANDGGASVFFIMILSVPIIVSNQWYRQANRIANLEKEQSDLELNLLKQQINPHFFFNTLNNLYALSITKDKQTPEVILQLSELMRYVIYKGKEETVSLGEEIKYIEDYVKLQQIRLHQPFDFKFEKTVLDEEKRIPPLLFITFVENAFKHGIEPTEGASYMHLELESNEEGLQFICTNSVDAALEPKEEPGIGLENLERRLALRFPHQHVLETKLEENAFLARLEIFKL